MLPLYAAEPAILTLDDFKTAKSVKLSIQPADHVSAERNDSPKSEVYVRTLLQRELRVQYERPVVSCVGSDSDRQRRNGNSSNSTFINTSDNTKFLVVNTLSFAFCSHLMDL